MQIVDTSGRRWAYFPANKSSKGLQTFTTDFEIMRGDLCQIFYDIAIKHRTKYIFGTSIENFEEKDSSVKVQFTDGKTDQFDLLVGADGQWSRTRRMMLGPDVPDAFYPLKGEYIGYFTIPRAIKEGEGYIATFYIATGRRQIMTRRHSPNEIQVYLLCTTDSERLKTHRGNVKVEKEALTEIFEGAGWQAEEILKCLEGADDFYCERMGVVKMDSWSRGHVVLAGDAAHCPSANTGMGTTSSLVGAYILAGEISKHCGRGEDSNERVDHKGGIETAIRAYEEKFRPFMDQVQEGVLENRDSSPMASTLFGVAIFNCILAIASFFRFNFFGERILKERVKDWSLPDYEDMLGE